VTNMPRSTTLRIFLEQTRRALLSPTIGPRNRCPTPVFCLNYCITASIYFYLHHCSRILVPEQDVQQFSAKPHPFGGRHCDLPPRPHSILRRHRTKALKRAMCYAPLSLKRVSSRQPGVLTPRASPAPDTASSPQPETFLRTAMSRLLSRSHASLSRSVLKSCTTQ
jgi:hypothetical protein